MLTGSTGPAIHKFDTLINTTLFELTTNVAMRTADDIEIRNVIEDEMRNYFVRGRNELRVPAKEKIATVHDENQRD